MCMETICVRYDLVRTGRVRVREMGSENEKNIEKPDTTPTTTVTVTNTEEKNETETHTQHVRQNQRFLVFVL